MTGKFVGYLGISPVSCLQKRGVVAAALIGFFLDTTVT